MLSSMDARFGSRAEISGSATDRVRIAASVAAVNIVVESSANLVITSRKKKCGLL